MKNYCFVFVSLLSFIVACSNDDDAKINPASIYGRWEIVANQIASDNDFVESDLSTFFDFDINGTVLTNSG
jgi:uncharacterized protein YcfL